ncbi:signal peptidase II [Vibrio sp. SCSIO 43136]|uniref:signal peptidase II n=1 Tax=Vibrio sp. SCSIO 43136 TaxID=2819101 RepID=UPI002074D2B2|nr:signal peptidase II [Vibrio sp. SCSIO 43136]USD66417.1 signal peptidase II [Vibrio sp. SCSIO 43136]
MKFWNKLLMVVSISLLCVGCDQGTKVLASNYLPKFQMDSYLHDLFRIGYTENTGAFLGLGSSLPSDHRFGLFVVAVSLFLTVLLVYVLFSKGLSMANTIALTLLLSGGASNLYDRVINNGAVIDFLNMGLGPLRTGVFNIADVAIILGGALFVLSSSNANQEKSAA